MAEKSSKLLDLKKRQKSNASGKKRKTDIVANKSGRLKKMDTTVNPKTIKNSRSYHRNWIRGCVPVPIGIGKGVDHVERYI